MPFHFNPSDQTGTHQRARRGSVEDAELMRHRILSTAYALFQEGGVDAIAMRKLAARIGVSAMTPYRYFSNKAEILTGLWDAIVGELLAQQKCAVAKQTTPRERLRANIDAYMKYWEKNPDQYQLVYMPDIKALDKNKEARSSAPAQAEIWTFSNALTEDYARSIGAPTKNIDKATQIRHFFVLGFLHSALVSTRHSKMDGCLRSDVIEQAIQATEFVLRE